MIPEARWSPSRASSQSRVASKMDQEEYIVLIEQLRAARGLLGWSQSELASRAGLSLPTVKRVEAEVGPRVSDEARAKLRRALELGGVEFIAENGGGPGVRLRKRKQRKP
jgi:transcriptional regulator with XRE-family HTH domain